MVAVFIAEPIGAGSNVGKDSIVDIGDAVDSGKASVRPKTA